MAPPGRGEDVAGLIAKKQYAKAIEVLKTQLKTGRPDPRLRNQLADVLVLTGKTKEAVAILGPVADEYAADGFAAQAIAILKKIQKLDPGRRDVEGKLANLIQTKQRTATGSFQAPTSAAPAFEIGMEEIGLDLGPIAAPTPSAPAPAPAPAPRPTPPPPPAPAPAPAPPPPAPAPAPRPAAPAPAPPVAAPPAPRPPAPAPAPAPPPAPAPAPPPRPAPAPAPAPAPVVAKAVQPPPAPRPTPPAPPPAEPVIMLDLGVDTAGPEFALTDPIGVEPEEVLPLVEPQPVEDDGMFDEAFVEPLPDETPAADEMSAGDFADELSALVEDVFANLTEDALPTMAQDSATQGGGSQIVVSPLFKDLQVDELVAVIQGLKLLTFNARDVIIREGDSGNSMYMLTAGTVRAFVRTPQGKQAAVADLEEGAFFGEISILTGKPRTATVVAVTHCELLELDRPTLDDIVKRHPHVMEIMKSFAAERLAAAKR